MPTVPVNSNLVAQSEAAAQAPRQSLSHDPGRCSGRLEQLERKLLPVLFYSFALGWSIRSYSSQLADPEPGR